jgi:amidohydrolase
MLLEMIKNHAKSIEEEIKNLRKTIHINPELGGEEFQTQALIIDYLAKIGVDEIRKSADTGVVGIIYGSSEGLCVGLRADIDALPIDELNEVEYKSKVPGKMHACGHDAHTAILLGAANVFCKMRPFFNGTIKLFFQPAEESFGGAKRMIEEGCLENPHVDYIIGLHVDNSIETGHVLYKYGVMQAMSSGLQIKVKGKGCHAAHPETGVDAIIIASKIIDGLQTIVSRNLSAFDPAVITIGKIQGGTVSNAVAEEVVMNGTIRTLSEEVTAHISKRVNDLVTNIARAYGGSAEVAIRPGYIPLINNDEVVTLFKGLAEGFLGKDNVHDKVYPSLGVEDFAYFAKARPSCFWNLGIANKEKGITAPGHNGNFDVDHDSLYYGVVLQTLTALELLKK